MGLKEAEKYVVLVVAGVMNLLLVLLDKTLPAFQNWAHSAHSGCVHPSDEMFGLLWSKKCA